MIEGNRTKRGFDMTREEVLEKVSKKREEFISWYHEFHQIPELGFEEKETTELICEKLTGMGIHPLRLDPTGVTACRPT